MNDYQVTGNGANFGQSYFVFKYAGKDDTIVATLS